MIAIVRLRGVQNLKKDIVMTFDLLRLKKSNHCVILPDTPIFKGMLKKVSNYSTYGKIGEKTLAELLKARLARKDGKPVDDKLVQKTIKALKSGKLLRDVEGIVPFLRLHPPRKGLKSIKKNVKQGGSLGLREEMDGLLKRMM